MIRTRTETVMSLENQEVERFVVVADIVGSTKLYVDLGDQQAKQTVTECLQQLGDVVQSNRGEVIGTAGDEITAVFEQPEDAANAASAMPPRVHNCTRLQESTGGRPIQISVGIHHGPILMNPFNQVSEVIAIARRLTEIAKAEQILLTHEALARLPPVFRAMTRYVDDEPWRGATAPYLQLHELIWEIDGLTAHSTSQPAASVGDCAFVVVQLPDQVLRLDNHHPVITAGRSSHNDIVVDCDLASREHFRLNLRHGRCILTDMSTNGTFVVGADGKTTAILRESAPITGQGLLYFGRPADENAEYALRYECRAE